MNVRAASEQSTPRELTDRIAELARCVAELAEQLRQSARTKAPEASLEQNSAAKPIELVTENGFAILRPWETDGSPAPADGSFCFLVRDPKDHNWRVAVEIADDLVAQIEMRSQRRILRGNSFWICCAERHLADYLWEHDQCPPTGKLRVEQLTAEELMLAISWEKTSRNNA